MGGATGRMKGGVTARCAGRRARRVVAPEFPVLPARSRLRALLGSHFGCYPSGWVLTGQLGATDRVDFRPNHLRGHCRARTWLPGVWAPDINTEQGQNILKTLLDCFEEKSLANDFSTNSTKSVLYSTPKIKDICIQSPSKEVSEKRELTQCQKSHSKSDPVSSRKNEASLQLIIEPSEVVNKSENQKKDKECKKKCFSSGSKKNKIAPEEVTSTVTRSRRISRRPSNCEPDNLAKYYTNFRLSFDPLDPFYSNSSTRNELSVYHNSRRKPAEEVNQSSKNIGKKTVPLKMQKRAAKGSSRAQKVLNAKDSGGIIDHDGISSCPQNESLEGDEADLAKKKNLDPSG
ncbi:Centromere protein C [Camelus dromedarius]|uniref:Centromere protein C n=1 Tax=Camelus dromedarius TaxID=9838 RepID=A0A5N4EHV6_CAMDR|nr:Centromere protein C [Camelus dromedarius]